MKYLSVILLLIVGSNNLMAQKKAKINYPKTSSQSVKDTLFGRIVEDPYRWLEDDNSPETARWVEKQNKVTEDYLSAIPYRKKMRERITDLLRYERFSAPIKAGKRTIYSRNDGLQNQSVYYIEGEGLNGPQVLIDPNKLNKEGVAAVSLLGLSKDKRFMAYSVNESGSDWKKIYVMDLQTLNKLDDEIDWVKFSGAAWYGNGFFYTRFPEQKDKFSAKNENPEIRYHVLGSSQNEDLFIYSDKNNPENLLYPQTTDDERFLFVYSEKGTSGNAVLFSDLSMGKPGNIKPLLAGYDFNYSVIGNIGEKAFFRTDRDAPNYKIISLNMNEPGDMADAYQNSKTFVAENNSLLESASLTGNKFFLSYLKDVSTHVYQYTTNGEQELEIELPGIGTASGFYGDIDDEETYYVFTSFTTPATIYRYSITDNASTLFRKPEVKFDPSDFTTEQVFFTSTDGTKVPMFLIYKKGLKKNGKNPTLLYGYGGFNISLTPSFSTSRLVWLENGGVFAMVNLRGGGEYGETWHKAGMFEKKQNVFDDFISAAEFLIAQKFTSPDYLACQGGSNGGLLIGAVLNQRPDLFRAANPQVGVMDMLRYHKFTIGKAWAAEYGNPDDEQAFAYLIQYSPLHNIKKQDYPSVMVTTADHDDRVVPAHSFKYIATLQNIKKGENPALIRIDVQAGHGEGKPLSKVIDEIGDCYSFFFYEMGYTPRKL